MSRVSAGILLFRRAGGRLEVLIGHPGGPFWRRQPLGSWSIPKGLAEPGETLEAVAEREFAEEVGFRIPDVAADPGRPPIDLGEVTLRSGKVIRAWAIEGDLDATQAHSNEIEIPWPPRSGQTIVVPEVDEVAWYDLEEAGRRLHPVQAEFLGRLGLALGEQP